MKQNVILNKIHEAMRTKFPNPSDILNLHNESKLDGEWDKCCQELADTLRSEGLEDSAKEAERWKVQ